MTPEQYRRVGELYHAAMELEPELRSDFLAASCENDAELRREVESLLRADEQAEDFISAKVAGVAATMVARQKNLSLIGRNVSHYQVLSLIGAGGMGEVYLAQDTRLGRKVAIKLLPQAFARNQELLLRFEQEALAASTLNHPNILTVYDVGTTSKELGNAPFIVAELLEGEELREQLNEVPMPVRKAIEYARQIAAGLAAAHEKGVVHRDLKPENLFVTKDGLVKILDFGLAKLKPQHAESESSDNTAQPRQLTNPGMIMGTVGYMSPEQVRGQNADHRSDIFSFGLIMFEMLAGRKAFQGESFAETMAAIAKEEPPDLIEANPKVSPQLQRIVCRCLEKQPERRFQTASDLGFALEALLTDSGARQREEATAPAVKPAISSPRWVNRETWWMMSTAVAVMLVAGLAWAYFTRSSALDAHPLKLSLSLPEKANAASFAVSPDGTWLAFTLQKDSTKRLWTLALATGEPKPLAGSEGAQLPFWSPDSRFIGFFTSDKLKKVEVGAGLPITLCDVRNGNGGTWNRDGIILFSTLDGGQLWRVLATGGAASVVMQNDPKRQEIVLRFPSFLPDGHHFLYALASNNKDVRGVYLGSLDGNTRQRLIGDYSNAVYVSANGASDNKGYLLFGHEKTLMAQPFTAKTLSLNGEPFTVSAQVGTLVNSVYRDFSASDNGVLVFDPEPSRQQKQVLWVDRSGKTINNLTQLEDVRVARLAPDGKHFAATNYDLLTNNFDLWLADVTGGNALRFTFDSGNDNFPVWSPYGNRIVWAANRGEHFQLYEKDANRAGQETPLLVSEYNKTPTDWSSDGRYIIYRQTDPKTRIDIWALPLFGEHKPFPVVQSEANENGGVVSPDGRWLAFYSDESGRHEIYLQSFPGEGNKQRVSINGGVWPYWRQDGKELYYRSLDDKLMAVSFTGQTSLIAGSPTALFEFHSGGQPDQPYYSVSGNGQRFLLNAFVDSEINSPLTVLVNWTAGVKK